jgi:6-phosphogluconolactonase
MADFHVFANAEDMSQSAAQLFIACSHQALNDRARFTVALSGGSTPKRFFEILACEPYWRAVPWDRTLIFWGDDRAVPPDDDQSNYKLAHDTLLSHMPIPEANIFRIRGELGADRAAEDTRRNLVNAFGDKETPRFDFALQGMGTDGHTASLFPNTDSLESTDWVIPVINPPAIPKIDRITMTFPVLNNARTALFLAAGKDKQSLIHEIMNDPTAPDRYPAARLEAEQTLWYVDEAALGLTVG